MKISALEINLVDSKMKTLTWGTSVNTIMWKNLCASFTVGLFVISHLQNPDYLHPQL